MALSKSTGMEFEPTLSPRFLAYVRDYLMDRDIDPGPIFDRAGIHSRKNEEYDIPIPVEQVVSLFEEAAEASENPCMGMSMAERYHYESSSILILAMLAAPDVETGVRCLSQYDRYIDTGIETRLDFSGPQVEFSTRLIIGENVRTDQLNEYLIVFLVQTLATATRKRVPLHTVTLMHSNGRNREALEEFLNAPVRFGSDYNSITFDKEFLRERFLSSNALLYEILTNALKTYFSALKRQTGFVDVVCREIIRSGGQDSTDTDTISRRLAISPRTLRRRLAEEGYSFQEAKNLARANRAKYFLSRTNMPLSEIAFELGYSELSAFSRAFRTWVGTSPQSYRRDFRQAMGA